MFERLYARADTSEAQSHVIIGQARSIKLGASVAQVKAMLGAPTDDAILLTKDGSFRSRILTYYLRKRNRLVNEKLDRYVSFYFDRTDKLTRKGFKLDEGLETDR